MNIFHLANEGSDMAPVLNLWPIAKFSMRVAAAHLGLTDTSDLFKKYWSSGQGWFPATRNVSRGMWGIAHFGLLKEPPAERVRCPNMPPAICSLGQVGVVGVKQADFARLMLIQIWCQCLRLWPLTIVYHTKANCCLPWSHRSSKSVQVILQLGLGLVAHH